MIVLFGTHCQVVNVAWAAYLFNDTAGMCLTCEVNKNRNLMRKGLLHGHSQCQHKLRHYGLSFLSA